MSDEKSRPRRLNTFSLTDFYARRAATGATIPTFAVRAPGEAGNVTTTAIGVTRAAAVPWKLGRGPRPERALDLGGPVGVVRSLCLAWQGAICWTCSERCPVEGVITLDAGRPIIDDARCIGCGECVAACPAPHNALKLVSAPTAGGST